MKDHDPQSPTKRTATRARRATAVLALAALGAAAWPVAAQPPGHTASPTPAQRSMLQRWLLERATANTPPTGARIEVELGVADPRLRLAPCARTEPYLPASSRPWGRTRVGLRCADGAVAWQFSLPATVRVLAPAPVLREPLPAGGTITQALLVSAEVDWADERDAPLADAAVLHGRRLARPLAAGAALRPTDLQPLRWFDAGARVRIDAVGRGWRVSGSGRALQAGLDGRRVRVRTDGGRIVSGIAVAVGRVEVVL